MKFMICSLAAIAVLCASAAADAQTHTFEITPFGGYTFGGSIEEGAYGPVTNAPPSKLDFANGATFGLVVDYRLPQPNLYLDFLWQRQSTQLDIEDRDTGEETKLGDVDVDYFHAGIIYEFLQNYEDYEDVDRVRPFLGASMGATRFTPAGDVADATQFSVAFVAGLKVLGNEWLGFRMALRLVTTYMDSDSEMFCDQDGNCFVPSDALLMNQVDLNAGVTFKL